MVLCVGGLSVSRLWLLPLGLFASVVVVVVVSVHHRFHYLFNDVDTHHLIDCAFGLTNHSLILLDEADLSARTGRVGNFTSRRIQILLRLVSGRISNMAHSLLIECVCPWHGLNRVVATIDK